MEDNEVVIEETKAAGLKAKDASLWSKIIGGSIILIGHILKWTGVLHNATSMEICACGFSVMGVFGTVDINILADKFTGGNR